MIRRRTLLLSTILALIVFSFSATPSAAQVATQPAPAPIDANARASQTLVDSTIPDDSAVNKMLEAYTPKVRGLSAVIGKLRGRFA